MGERILGIGTDVVDVDRLRAVLERTPSFAARVFADDERAYADAAADPAERYAARFAAKEAVLKSLGLGLGGLPLREVAVVRAESGAPGIRLVDRAASIAAAHGVDRLLLSLSHAGGVAVATVVAIGLDDR